MAITANVSRGKRKKQDQDELIPSILEPEGSSKECRRNWARLIQKIYEVDPLTCPKCKGRMSTVTIHNPLSALIPEPAYLVATFSLTHKAYSPIFLQRKSEFLSRDNLALVLNTRTRCEGRCPNDGPFRQMLGDGRRSRFSCCMQCCE